MPLSQPKTLLLLLVLTLSCLHYTVTAHADAGKWYLSAHTGVSQLGDTSGQTLNVGSTNGKASIGLDNGFLAGMAVGYRYATNWMAEIAWEYRSNDSETMLADGTKFNDGNYASNVFYLNGLYHFSIRGNWEPYVGVGLGWIQEIDLDLEDSNVEISYSGDGNIGWQFIAGINYHLNDDWSITGKLRYAEFGSIDLADESSALDTIQSLEYAPATYELGIAYRF